MQIGPCTGAQRVEKGGVSNCQRNGPESQGQPVTGTALVREIRGLTTTLFPPNRGYGP
jgi:hypothetical protein